ncbi:MAG: ATP phosphoribosyltransferase regulatory subunit, partial [Thermoanaerobaculia bacterium]
QIGAELIGDASREADIAMLRLAASFVPNSLVVYTDASLDFDGDPRFVLHEDERSDCGYYTGVRFWVYSADRRVPLAQGGRYDTLYERFGAAAPAIGFTFTIDGLED